MDWIVTQGLGGPQILLQGLVGSGSVVLISPSGGGPVRRASPGRPLGGVPTFRRPGGRVDPPVRNSGTLSCVRPLRRGWVGAGACDLRDSSDRRAFTGSAVPERGGTQLSCLREHGIGRVDDYSVCVATVTGQSWTTPALTVPCHFKLGVRVL